MTPETRRHTGRKTAPEAQRPGFAAESAADRAYGVTARRGQA